MYFKNDSNDEKDQSLIDMRLNRSTRELVVNLGPFNDKHLQTHL